MTDKGYTGPTGGYYAPWYHKQFSLTRQVNNYESEIIRIQSEIDNMGGTGVTGSTGIAERIQLATDQINFLDKKQNKINKKLTMYNEKLSCKMTEDEIIEAEAINTLFNNKYQEKVKALILMSPENRDDFFMAYRNSETTDQKEDVIKCFFNLL